MLQKTFKFRITLEKKYFRTPMLQNTFKFRPVLLRKYLRNPNVQNTSKPRTVSIKNSGLYFVVFRRVHQIYTIMMPKN